MAPSQGLRDVGESIVLMGKNTMMKRSIRLYCERTGDNRWPALTEILVGNVGLIFTKADLAEVPPCPLLLAFAMRVLIPEQFPCQAICLLMCTDGPVHAALGAVAGSQRMHLLLLHFACTLHRHHQCISLTWDPGEWCAAAAGRGEQVQGGRARARGPGGAQRRRRARRQHRPGPLADLLLPGAPLPPFS